MLKALNASVTHLCKLVKVQGIVNSFREELKNLCRELLTLASIQANLKCWNEYITCMACCLGQVLDQQKIKVIVMICTKCETKDKKKAAVQSAQMDVEMKDTMKTIMELVSKKVKIKSTSAIPSDCSDLMYSTYFSLISEEVQTSRSSESGGCQYQWPLCKEAEERSQALHIQYKHTCFFIENYSDQEHTEERQEGIGKGQVNKRKRKRQRQKQGQKLQQGKREEESSSQRWK